MSVLKQKSSNIYLIRFQINGKKYQKSSRTRNKTKALEIERKWRNQITEDIQQGSSEVIQFYEALKIFHASKVGLKTFDDIGSKIRTVKEYFPDRSLHLICTRDLELFVNQRKTEGRATQTIEHSIIQIRGCVNYAKKMGYKVNDLEYPKLKIDNQRVRCLTRDEEARLLLEMEPTNPNYCSSVTPMNSRSQLLIQRQDNYDFVICLLDTGARYSEIANLTFGQIDLTSRTIRLVRSKTNNESTLFMSNRVYKVLKRRFEKKTQNKWIFTNKSGFNQRNHSTISIRRAITNAGIEDFKVHDFRHTCASRLVQNGLTIQEVAIILGHKNLSTTLRYAHHEQKQVAVKMKTVLDAINDKSGVKNA